MNITLELDKHYNAIVYSITKLEERIAEDSEEYKHAIESQNKTIDSFMAQPWYKRWFGKKPQIHDDPRFPEPRTSGSEIYFNMPQHIHSLHMAKWHKDLRQLKIMKELLELNFTITVTEQDYKLFRGEMKSEYSVSTKR